MDLEVGYNQQDKTQGMHLWFNLNVYLNVSEAKHVCANTFFFCDLDISVEFISQLLVLVSAFNGVALYYPTFHRSSKASDRNREDWDSVGGGVGVFNGVAIGRWYGFHLPL